MLKKITDNKMKLAEALLMRSDLQTKLESLRTRLKENSLVQEGLNPIEDPTKLLQESFGVTEQLRVLIIAINKANLKKKVKDGRSIMEVITEKDKLSRQHKLLLSTIESTKTDKGYYSRSEVRWVTCIDVKKLQAQADDFAIKIRKLNALIQESNWLNDLD